MNNSLQEWFFIIMAPCLFYISRRYYVPKIPSLIRLLEAFVPQPEKPLLKQKTQDAVKEEWK